MIDIHILAGWLVVTEVELPSHNREGTSFGTFPYFLSSSAHVSASRTSLLKLSLRQSKRFGAFIPKLAENLSLISHKDLAPQRSADDPVHTGDVERTDRDPHRVPAIVLGEENVSSSGPSLAGGTCS